MTTENQSQLQDERLTEIRYARERGVLPWAHLSNSQQQAAMAGKVIDYLLSLLQQPTSERCGECGHKATNFSKEQGRCLWGDSEPCGHRCVFPATAPADPQDGDEVDSTVVYPTPGVKGPQWVECPYCGCGTRIQILRGQGVMGGWGECPHYYSASNDAATKPGVVFTREPQPLSGPTSEAAIEAAREIVGPYEGGSECPWCAIHPHCDPCTFQCGKARLDKARHERQILKIAAIISKHITPDAGEEDFERPYFCAVRALRHLKGKNHDFEPLECDGCKEVALFLTEPGYRGDEHNPIGADCERSY